MFRINITHLKIRIFIVDETFIKQIPNHFTNVFSAPFTGLAVRVFKVPIAANVIALGALAAITQIISRKALIKTILADVPEKVLVIDRMAVDLGFKLVTKREFSMVKP